jgi:hypothetical protein
MQALVARDKNSLSRSGAAGSKGNEESRLSAVLGNHGHALHKFHMGFRGGERWAVTAWPQVFRLGRRPRDNRTRLADLTSIGNDEN